MEKSIEKSKEQAEIIKMIALPVEMLDVEYCRQAAKDMKEDASRQEAMALFNPNYPQLKNDILREKGNALSILCDYVSSLKKIQQMQRDLEKEEKIKEDISKLFH